MISIMQIITVISIAVLMLSAGYGFLSFIMHLSSDTIFDFEALWIFLVGLIMFFTAQLVLITSLYKKKDD